MSKSNHKSVEEFSVSTIEIGGLNAAMTALHLPFSGRKKSQAQSRVDRNIDEYGEDKCFYATEIYMNSSDKNLVKVLCKRGDEHAKVLRGITVWCQINAPRYWWQEMATYRIGAEGLSSESTMHVQGRDLDEDELVEMKEHIEEGLMQKRVYMFSYQTLSRIYRQRRNHRLPQWRIFCEWIETLPFALEWIAVNGNNNRDK